MAIRWRGSLAGAPLVRRGTISLVANAARIAFQAIGAAIVARVLGPTALGHYAFAVAVAMVAIVPAQFGLTTLLLRDGAAASAGGDAAALAALWRWAAWCGVAATLVVVVAAGGLGWTMRGQWSALDWPVYAAGLALIPLAALANVVEAALQGVGRTAIAMIPAYLVRPGGFALMLGILLLTGHGFTAMGVMVVQLAAHAASAALIIWWLVRNWPRPTIELIGAPPRGSDGRHRAALSFLYLHLLWVVLSQTDLLVLGAISTADQVGQYRVASVAAAFVSTGFLALTPIVGERIAFLHRRGDRHALVGQVRRAGRIALAIATPIAIGLVGFGGDALALAFGPPFARAAPVVAILAAGQWMQVALGFAPAVLMMTGRQRSSVRVLIVAACANVPLNLMLVPGWGAVGGAVATALATTGQAVALWWIARRGGGVDTAVWAMRPADTLHG